MSALDAALEAVLRRVVREELAAALAGRGTPEHATARENPLGSERAFLAAARKGAFPTFRAGRQVAARWSDVVAWMESRPIDRSAPEAPPESTSRPKSDEERLDEQLERAGVVLRPRSRARR